MRKLFAILLLGCLLFVTAGYHLVYRFRIAEAKNEMKLFLLHLSSESLTTFRFSESEMAQLDWEEANEFRYQGEMYDVVSVEKSSGQVLVRCVSDKTETALLNAYYKVQRQEPQNTSSNTILKLLGSPFLPTAVVQVHAILPFKTTVFKTFFSPLSSADKRILTPPPQVC